jgi:hypothetical protein
VTGALVTIAGAGLMGGMVFAPWLGPGSASSGSALTGWDISDMATGGQKWFISDFFDGFSPFFPGLTVLVVAAIVALIGVGLLVAVRRVRGGTAVLLRLIGIAAMALPVVDVAIVLTSGPGADIVFFQWGLIGTVVGGLGAVFGIAWATGKPPLTRGVRTDA